MKRVGLHLLMWPLVAVTFLAVFDVQESMAIPSFARKYKTSCVTCHYAYPVLNAFGRAFLNNGFRYPGGDEGYVKEEPIKLGAESYKRVWPDAIWPADVAGTSPVSFHFINRFRYKQFDTPHSSFEFPHELEVLMAGTVGENFSYFGEIEFEEKEEIGYGFFIQYDQSPYLHARFGKISPLPIPDGRRLTPSHYNYGNFRAASKAVGGTRLRDDSPGIELIGSINGPGGRGGFTAHAGVLNGQSEDETFNDNNNSKDVFIRAEYKFGGLGVLGGTEGGASSTAKHWQDDHATIGGFVYRGNPTLADTTGTFANSFTAVGANGEVWYKDFWVQGVYIHEEDDNPGLMSPAVEEQTDAWFVEGRWAVFPWVFALTRYEYTKTGQISGMPDPDPVTRIVPALVVLPRANVRVIAQYDRRVDDNRDKTADLLVLQLDMAF